VEFLHRTFFLLQETISGYKVSASDLLFWRHKFSQIKFKKWSKSAEITLRCGSYLTAVNFHHTWENHGWNSSTDMEMHFSIIISSSIISEMWW